MHIKDLAIVNIKNNELKISLKEYNVIDAQLKPNNKGYYNHGQMVRLGIGGDSYGNGELLRITMPVSDCIDAKKILLKMKSDAWGKVCGLRADLRLLGVNIDEKVAVSN